VGVEQKIDFGFASERALDYQVGHPSCGWSAGSPRRRFGPARARSV
jgi:hypothetical protein